VQVEGAAPVADFEDTLPVHVDESVWAVLVPER
jgi:hypothetical protein